MEHGIVGDDGTKRNEKTKEREKERKRERKKEKEREGHVCTYGVRDAIIFLVVINCHLRQVKKKERRERERENAPPVATRRREVLYFQYYLRPP